MGQCEILISLSTEYHFLTTADGHGFMDIDRKGNCDPIHCNTKYYTVSREIKQYSSMSSYCST